MINTLKKFLLILFFCLLSMAQTTAQEGEKWITFEPENGPGNGQHIVLVSGDEEYRSEEALPMLAKTLSKHHGFKTTVLFAIDPETGNINPDHQTNIPGMEQLRTADLMVMMIRFRELPDEQMKYFDAYLQSGKPIVAMRTSTHAFSYERNPKSPYAHYHFQSETPGWQGGFGRQVLGETWVDHHGDHGNEGTRGLINGVFGREDHPIIRGVNDIWTYTDVYGTRELKGDCNVLVWGQSTKGMTPEAPVNLKKSIMPVAWTKEYTSEQGNTSRIFTTTMGSSKDFENEDLRRLIINACYWGLEMGEKVSKSSSVDIIGEYDPTMFGFGEYQKGRKPSFYK